MPRRTRYQSFSAIRKANSCRASRATSTPPDYCRRLRLEPLEDRRLLAGVVVSNHLDGVNGDTNTIELLIANDGGDGISLREAILAANATAGTDQITFVPALSGQTITLLGGMELVIAEALTIDARPLAANVTIAASGASRILNITATTGDLLLGGLTLTGGLTTGNNANSAENTFSGGAIRSLTNGRLTIDQSTISGNRTMGDFARGGGVFANRALTVTQSIIDGNSTAGSSASGGGIYAGYGVILTQSSISGNSTTGFAARGGGVLSRASAAMLVHSSVISGNSTTGDINSFGGGIRAYGALTLTRSTVSGNSTNGHGGGISAAFGTATFIESTISGNSSAGRGGGIFAYGDVTLTRSTVSGNSTAGSSANGGGIFAWRAVSITQSTVTDNRALHANATGGGVFQDNSDSNYAFSISGSIVAANTSSGGGPDLVKDLQSTLTVNRSVVGTGIVAYVGGNNVATDNPLLAPLANNGGPTQTHATLANSPAINLGDPSIPFDPSEFDQRGAPFVRVFGGRIDAGAYERQTVAGLNFVVDTTSDTYDFDFSLGQMSLREAVGLANGVAGADTITFAPALSGATIALGGTEIEVSEALAIDARPLAANVMVDAQQFSRIFNITATTGDYTLGGLTLIRGRTTPDGASGQGGAIRSQSSGLLTIGESTISGSQTTGVLADGGGLFANGDVTLSRSTVSGNGTSNAFGRGGGVASFGNITLSESTVSGNTTEESSASGGGIFANGEVTVNQSTVSGNSTSGNNSPGGGIRVGGNLVLLQSTVTENSVTGSLSYGAGVFQYGGFGREATITGSILSGNGFADFAVNLDGTYLIANDSLIGSGVAPNEGSNNVVNNTPMLGPLADNGGPTMTQVPLEGSPAIDMGDMAAMAGEDGVPLYDQRGIPFSRVFDGDNTGGARIDIGAVEMQPDPRPALPGDYNQNGEVDAADYVMWRKTFGNTGVPAFSGTDGDGDTTIDQDDYGVWRAHFGMTLGAASVELRAGTGTAIALAVPVAPGLAAGSVEQRAESRTTVALERPDDGVRLLPLAKHGTADPRSGAVDWSPNLRDSRLDATAISRRDDRLLAWLAAQDRDDDPDEAVDFMSNGDEETSQSTAAAIAGLDALFESLPTWGGLLRTATSNL